MTESEQGSPAEPASDENTETPEAKRARIMARLAEMIRGDPPDLSGSGSGPVSASGLPVLPSSADEFDQDSAAELFAALGQFFERHKQQADAEGDTEGPAEE